MQDDELNLLELYRSLLEEWQVIFGIAFLAALVSILIVLAMKPVYRAEVVVAEIKSQPFGSGTTALMGQFGGLAGLAGVDLGALGSGRGPARATLHSRMLAEEFIRRNNLLPEIYHDDWDTNSNGWRPGATQPSMWMAVDEFVNTIRTVREDMRTGLVTLSIEWTDPDAAASWANGLVALANDLLRSRDLDEAERNIAYLRQQVERTNTLELQQAMYRLIEAELKTVMLANARHEYAFTVVDPAVSPETRVRPRRTVITVLGTFVGALLGLLVAGIRQTIKRQRLRAETG